LTGKLGDRVARSALRQQPSESSLGVDAFVQCQGDELLGRRFVGNHPFEPTAHRSFVAGRPQIGPGISRLARFEQQLAHFAACLEIGFFEPGS